MRLCLERIQPCEGEKSPFLFKYRPGEGERGPKMPLALAQHLLPLTPCDITRYRRTFRGDDPVARRMRRFDVTKSMDLLASLFGTVVNFSSYQWTEKRHPDALSSQRTQFYAAWSRGKSQLLPSFRSDLDKCLNKLDWNKSTGTKSSEILLLIQQLNTVAFSHQFRAPCQWKCKLGVCLLVQQIFIWLQRLRTHWLVQVGKNAFHMIKHGSQNKCAHARTNTHTQLRQCKDVGGRELWGMSHPFSTVLTLRHTPPAKCSATQEHSSGWGKNLTRIFHS